MKASAMSNLLVDDRYQGNHGIGRYAAEVIPRLTMPWSPLATKGSPLGLRDVLNLERLRAPRNSVIYSPGFGAGPSRARQIVTVHDLTHLHMPRGRRGEAHRVYYDKVLRPIIKSAGHVLTVSPSSARDIQEWLADDTVQVHDGGNGCSDTFVVDGPVLSRSRPFFLYVGNLKPHKNPRPVFEAMQRFPNHDLLVITSDVDEASILAAESGISGQVVVESGLDDARLAAAYRGCSAFLFPSVMEGFGLPVVEAWKCGAPVVYHLGCRAVADICQGRQFGVASAFDPDEFANAMTRASAGVQPIPELSGYRWEDVAARVDAVVRSVWTAVTDGR